MLGGDFTVLGRPPTGQKDVNMEIGQVYNPYRLFNGSIIPEWLCRAKTVSLGAKVVFARLGRYAGDNGLCYPAVDTLAEEIGIGSRQAQRYIAELEQQGLIQRVKRFSDKGQSSNAFEFLWHPLIEAPMVGVTDVTPPRVSVTPPPVTDMTPTPVSDVSPKESHVLRESRVKQNPPREDFDSWMNQEPEHPEESAPTPVIPIRPKHDNALSDEELEAKYGPRWKRLIFLKDREEERKLTAEEQNEKASILAEKYAQAQIYP